MSLKEDLAHLDTLAYRRREYLEPELRRYHAVARKNEGRSSIEPLANLHQWVLAPITLWPLNFHDIFRSALAMLEASQPFDPDMLFFLSTLPTPPDEEVCREVALHEHLVESGRYEELVNAAAKSDSIEQSIVHNPQFQEDWEKFTAHWDISKFANAKGIIRRSLSGERNLRPGFHTDWAQPSQRFQAAFDAFCHRWNLYGMQGDKPLVTKLSVNLTPHGTMIFIPAYWSLDVKRDIRWPSVKELHRTRSLGKQGEALAEGQQKRRTDAEKLRILDAETKRLRLRGAKKHAYLCRGLGFVEETDPRRLARLRKEFPPASIFGSEV